jgi:hypothetical protein
MSIRDEIEWRKNEERLVVFEARVKWAQCKRVILMCPEVDEALNQERNSPKDITRWAALEADMSWFVEAGYVNRQFLKRLTKVHEVWTLRSVRPKPSLRVFGRFAEPDVFIATHIVERSELGEKDSEGYRREILRCKSKWSQLFTSPPHSGKSYNDYITENATEQPAI